MPGWGTCVGHIFRHIHIKHSCSWKILPLVCSRQWITQRVHSVAKLKSGVLRVLGVSGDKSVSHSLVRVHLWQKGWYSSLVHFFPSCNGKYICRLFSFIHRDVFWPQICGLACGIFHFHNLLAMFLFTEAVWIKQGYSFVEKSHPTCLGLFLENRLLIPIIIFFTTQLLCPRFMFEQCGIQYGKYNLTVS